MPLFRPKPPDPAAGLPRLVLDTNVFFGSAWSQDNPAGRLLDLWRTGEIALCVSAPVVEEYRHVLSRTPRTRQVLDALLAGLDTLPNTVFCEPVESIRIIRKDKSDNKFVECAVATDASCIISSDKHLRTADGFRGLVVLSAGAYLKRHEKPVIPTPGASIWFRALNRLRRIAYRASAASDAGPSSTRKNAGNKRRATRKLP